MFFRAIVFTLTLSLISPPPQVVAQAVAPLESQQSISAGTLRARNVGNIRTFFSSARVRSALGGANMDYRRVDEAVEKLSQDDLARVAAQTQQIQKDMIVSPLELREAISGVGRTRAKNLSEVRTFLSSDRVRAALKSARVDFQRVDKAVATLSPDDLARVATRTQQMREDFAAGDDRDDILLLLYAALVITIILVIIYCVTKDEYGYAHCN